MRSSVFWILAEHGGFISQRCSRSVRKGEARIARHRKMRAAKKFSTIECYTNLKEVELEPGSDVLLECMSNLTANEIFDPSGAGKARTEEEILAGVSRLANQARNLVLVTNEIFSDGYRYEGGDDGIPADPGKH